MAMPKIDNGQHNGSLAAFSNGDIVTFTCNKKYRLIGANTVTCGDFGIWSASPPTCDGIRGNYFFVLFSFLLHKLFETHQKRILNRAKTIRHYHSIKLYDI